MSITLVILIITGLISYQGLNNHSIINSLKHHPYSEYHKKEYYRLLSSGFVHGSMGHLLINVFVLYMFGSYIEKFFQLIYGDMLGNIYFCVMYLTAIIAANLPTHFRHKNNASYAAVGASGATSAIVIIFCILNPWEWFLYPPVPAIVFAIGYLWYSSWADKNKSDGIGHSAHLFGALYGALFLLVTKPSVFEHFYLKIMEGPIWPPPFF
jgi:membrane associated rhomboid family serine protease